MGKYLKLCLLILGCGLVFGCASKQNVVDQSAREERFRLSYEAALTEEQAQASGQLLRKARSAIGVPYVRGGSNPGGFDCSGFVSWTYKSVGVNLPRTAREQSTVGQRVSNVEDMRAGDIVAFRHPRRGYHTGIYVGEGKFIHSPRRRTTVRINSLSDPYFSTTFLGARRVSFEGSEALMPQTESILNDYAEEKSVHELSTPQKKAGKARSKVKNRRASRDNAVQVASNDTRSRAKAAPTRAAKVEKSKAERSSKNKGSVSRDSDKKKSPSVTTAQRQDKKSSDAAAAQQKNRKSSDSQKRK